MCLIAFAYHCHPKYSLIVAANRDESYQRPTDLLDFWQDNTSILAGRDNKKFGTWLGISKTGRFAAITNYRDGTEETNARCRSRGELPRNFLCSHLPAQQYLHKLNHTQAAFSGFNLLLGDSTGLYYFSNKTKKTQTLQPGIYTLSNALLDTPWPKAIHIKTQLTQAIANNELAIDSLITLMKDQTQAKPDQLPNTGISHEWEAALSSIFIKTNLYGTRATTILLQEKTGTTQIVEQSYNAQGEVERRAHTLNILPVL